MIDVAYAQGAGAAPAGGGGFSIMIPLVLMFLVFYFLLIRPQKKKQQAHQEMLRGLKVGDKVITTGGLVGVIVEGGDPLLKLEVADKIRVEVGRGYIAGRMLVKETRPGEPATPAEAQSPGPSAQSRESGGLLGKLFKK